MKKFIVAAAVICVASFAGIKSAEAQAPARVGGYGSYPGSYGTYPSQYPSQRATTEHARKHHARKHEQRDNDHDADDARYGQNSQYGTYGYPNGTYGYPSGTYGYPSSNVPARVQPSSGRGTYNVPSRVTTPQQQVHSRDWDGHGNDRDR